MTMIGLGYRQPLALWIANRPDQVRCLEITAEHFFDGDLKRLRHLGNDYPLFVHGLSLSLGTPGELDERALAQFGQVVDAAQPEWISEHIAFTRSADVNLGHLNPVPHTQEMLTVLVDHVQELRDRFDRRVLLENITSPLQLPGEMAETEFINQLCDRAGCGLLLDVTNLYINSRNHRYDPLAWLHAIRPESIVQLHAVGYETRDGKLHDSHSQPIQEDIMALITEVLAYAPVKAIVLERDDDGVPLDEIRKDLHRLEVAVEQNIAPTGA
jgi:hypothetical protein